MSTIMQIMDTAWSRALRDPLLRDLPYKVETNEHGQLVMSPQKPRHGRIQFLIGSILQKLQPSGVAAVEFAVETSAGVKLPDVVWISTDRWRMIPDDAEASSIAPEICIEVLSDSNTRGEIDEKRRLYFEQEAREVWTCDSIGQMRFFTPAGEVPGSSLVPSFPVQVEI